MKINKIPLKFKKRKDKRTIIKSDGAVPLHSKKGKIIAIEGTSILVMSDENILYECITAGTIISKNLNQSLISVGDIVIFIPEENLSYKKGTIIKVEERINHFSRKEVRYPKEDVIASNIDRLIIMVSVKQPQYNKRLIDRFLVTAELNMIQALICINKIDLEDNTEIRSDFEVYQNLGIKTYFISAKYKTGFDQLQNELKNKTSVLSGPSGTGKSTFLNSIIGENYQSVKEASKKTNKGKHTTSAVRLFKMPNGGEIIDTPGIREFAIWGLDKNELALYFHEFDKYNPKCKYYPCTHTHEPGCAVIEAVKKASIDPERYESYLLLYESLD
jgi:ribosome biogenesis GTPase / thiamine phosphate phosphatase